MFFLEGKKVMGLPASKIKLAEQIYPNVEDSALLTNRLIRDLRLTSYWDITDK